MVYNTKKGKRKMFKLISVLFLTMFLIPAYGASVVANINGTPITDADITARTKLMALQGKTSTDNRRVALQNIIDDSVKIAYASNFNVVPDDKTVDKEFKKMKLGDLSTLETQMAKNALRAEIAWQIVVARTILPTVDVTAEDINAEKVNLAREHGLPLEVTIIRLTDIPADVAQQLSKPKSCDNAMEIAENLGGVPQRFTAMQYELSADIRERTSGLSNLTWTPLQDNTVLLVCETKKTKEYKDLDTIIKQNAQYKQAMFLADQQLKQLRRRAVVVINDDRYKL